MKRFGFIFLAVASMGSFASQRVTAAATNQPADFQEVYDLVRAHLAGSSEKELNRAAVQGLVSQLSPRVTIVASAAEPNAETKPISKASVFDGAIGYVRIARVSDGLAGAIRDAHQELNSTNKLKGLVLDLRFAGGDDYSEAVDAADLFCAGERALLDFGKGMSRSKSKSDAVKIPVAILVNHQTAGAPEALASVLRETGVGLILGTNTAGQAAITKDFDLKNGERLRIATALIKLGDGTTVPMRGVKPDIEVAVSAADEKVFFADPFADPATLADVSAGNLSSTNSAGTNRLRRRISEADLVRARRDGATLDDLTDRDGPEKPEVHDPALARALDVLKGLAVVRQFKAN